MIALSLVQRRVVLGCGLALVVGSSAVWPSVALSQLAPASTATPDPSALTAYKPEPLPLRDYSRDPDPFRADIASVDVRPVPVRTTRPVVLPAHIAAAGPGVVPDLTAGVAAGLPAGFDRQDYGIVRALGTNFALLERGGAAPIVRVGDILGNAKIVRISDAGVELSNGVRLELDTLTQPTPAPSVATQDTRSTPPGTPAAPATSAPQTPALAPQEPTRVLIPRLAPTPTQGDTP